jgi:hypothetical protein
MPASFLPRAAFAWRVSRAASLIPLTHAAAQAGGFETLSSRKYGFGKVLFTQISRRYRWCISDAPYRLSLPDGYLPKIKVISFYFPDPVSLDEIEMVLNSVSTVH